MQKKLPPATISIKNQPVPLVVRRSKRARRYSLRYRPLKQDILLTLPQRASLATGLAFIEERKAWLQAQLSKTPVSTITHGASIPILGTECILQSSGTARGLVKREGNVIMIPGSAEFFERRLKDFLKKEVKLVFTELSHDKAARIGARVQSLTLKDTSSRWGSCSARGHLSFSWRLIFAPYEVLDYLVAHEVAHLVEFNHSPRFWKLVHELCPAYTHYRDWLKTYGNELYKY